MVHRFRTGKQICLIRSEIKISPSWCILPTSWINVDTATSIVATEWTKPIKTRRFTHL